MTIEEIYEMWEEDSQMNPALLDTEALKISQLHNKYIKILSMERLKLRKMELEFSELKKIKNEYYNGTLDIDTIKERGYVPLKLKLLKQDVPMYLDADEEMNQFKLKIIIAQEKIELLDSILRIIGNRGFQIKNAIEWKKFMAGEF